MNAPGVPASRGSRMLIACPGCGTPIDRSVVAIEKRKLLVVEGRDEEEFFAALLSHLDLPDIQVAGIGGKQQIKPRLKALVKDPGFSKILSLGVIRDADKRPTSAFQSVRDALIAAGLPSPKQPLRPAKGPPRVNVMILPSAVRKGALEDLCLETMAGEPAMACADEFFDCIRQRDIKWPKEISKARVRVFLSSREDPKLPLGIAAQRGYWPFDHAAFQPLREFLRSL